MNKNDKDLSPIVIDFSKARTAEGRLDESWWLTFGALMRWIMPSLYRGSVLPLQIKGSQQEISSFANALSKEKRYLRSWQDHGLDNPQTYKSKSMLQSAISKFERITGLKWPFAK